jgi:hypothetical protein
MTGEEAANLMIQKRGYVVSCYPIPMRLNTVLPALWTSPKAYFGRVDHPFVIISEATLEDLEEQRIMLGLPPNREHDAEFPYRYRLITD